MYEILTDVELPKLPKEIETEARKIQKRINFKNWDAKNKNRRKEYRSKWKEQNPEKLKEHTRKYQLKMKYGITLDQYDNMLLLQGGHCALCNKTPDDERDKVLSVDHCHKTNKVRGLLCNIHNRALGAFGDNEEGLLKAIDYLRDKVAG